MRYLSFHLLPAELLETVLSDIASAVMDAPIDLGGFARRGFKSDRRTRRLRADGVEVVEVTQRTWEPGRDGGWGYSMTWTLRAKAPCGSVRISFSGGGWEPVPNGMLLSIEGIDEPSFRRLHARLRARLGPDTDRSHAVWLTVDNVEAALAAGAVELARELFAAAWHRPGAGDEPLFETLKALRGRLFSDDELPAPPRQAAPAAPLPPARKPRPPRTPKPPPLRPAPSPPPLADGPDKVALEAALAALPAASGEPCEECARLGEGWLMVANQRLTGETEFGVRHPTLAPCLGVFRRVHAPSDQEWHTTNHIQRCAGCGQLYDYGYDYDSDMFYGGTSIDIRKVGADEALQRLVTRLRQREGARVWSYRGGQVSW